MEPQPVLEFLSNSNNLNYLDSVEGIGIAVAKKPCMPKIEHFLEAYPSAARKAKRFAVGIVVLVNLNPFYTPSASARESSVFGSVVAFTGGVFSAFMIHEASHAAAARVVGTKLSWEIGNYNQPIAFAECGCKLSNSKGFALYSAGLVSQAVASEIILRSNRIDKDSAFVRGMMTWNILNPILYSLDYWFFRVSNRRNGNCYQGDLQGIENYSSKGRANAFAFSVSAIALWQGYRFFKTQSWAPDWVKH